MGELLQVSSLFESPVVYFHNLKQCEFFFPSGLKLSKDYLDLTDSQLEARRLSPLHGHRAPGWMAIGLNGNILHANNT